jgi:hypothetical protein
MTAIDIISVTGLNNPYLIEVCDVYGTNCILLAQVFTTVPPPITIILPYPFNSAPAIGIKLSTIYGCEKFITIDCSSLASKQFQDLQSFDFMDYIIYDFQD